jgi:hypothetical protein
MRTDLDHQLVTTYPEIFRDRHKPMTETAMCWGFACGDGWYPLINTLCRLIMSQVRSIRIDIEHTHQQLARTESMSDGERRYYTPERLAALERKLADAEAELPVASQVKEKFGGLRFYIDGGTDEHRAYIRFAEEMSYTICETCGTTTNVVQTVSGWVYTTCRPCAAIHNLTDRLPASIVNPAVDDA